VQLKKPIASLCVCVVCASAGLRAETAFFENGNSISVKSHRIDGDSVVLMLRDGGEMVSSSSSIVRFGPDDGQYVQPAASVPATAPVLASMSTSGPPYNDIVEKVAAAYSVPANLVHAMIEVESGYDERAVSRTGAKGLMQLMPETARRFNVDDPFDARQNIEGGVRYLKTLLDQFPLKLAVAAYNAGENAVRRFRGVPPYAETRGYVARVLRLVRK
jgi:soluble lytic murein transglycosylase-like protein